MLTDLLTGNVPSLSFDPRGREWDFLRANWHLSSPSLTSELTDEGPVWRIAEQCGDYSFEMVRNQFTMNRNTLRNDLGLIGFSLIDPKDTKVIVTEGVSDYFTAKLLCPDSNVLGFTSLGGSSAAKAIVLSLFDKIVYCADNDEAGLTAGMKVKAFLESYGKSVRIFTAPTPYKDITEALMGVLRCKLI